MINLIFVRFLNEDKQLGIWKSLLKKKFISSKVKNFIYSLNFEKLDPGLLRILQNRRQADDFRKLLLKLIVLPQWLNNYNYFWQFNIK